MNDQAEEEEVRQVFACVLCNCVRESVVWRIDRENSVLTVKRNYFGISEIVKLRRIANLRG